MPIYEYVCDDCKEHYETIVLSSHQRVECPKCASTQHTLQLSVFRAGKSSSASEMSSSTGGCGCTPRTCGCN